MTGIGWIMTIILGGIAGFIAEKIMKADMGVLMNIIVGIVGALLLNFLLGLFGIYAAGDTGLTNVIIQCVVAVIGACLLIFIYRAIRGRT